jgi:hypothetical protein
VKKTAGPASLRSASEERIVEIGTKGCGGLRPSFLGPRIPDFLSSVVALSKTMRLSLREKPHKRSWLVLRSRKSGQRWCEHGAPVRSCGDRTRLEGEACGIPHLAKNERDVGHPTIGAGIEPKRLLYERTCGFFCPVLTHTLKPSIYTPSRFRGLKNPLPPGLKSGATPGWARIKPSPR